MGAMPASATIALSPRTVDRSVFDVARPDDALIVGMEVARKPGLSAS